MAALVLGPTLDLTSRPTRLALSPAATLAAAIDSTGALRTWPSADTKPSLRRLASKPRVTCIAFADESTLVAGDESGAIRAWDAPTGELRWEVTRHRGAVRGVAVVGADLASVGVDGRFVVGALGTSGARIDLKRPKPFTALAVIANRLVAAASEARSLVVFKTDGATAEEVWCDRSTYAPADDVHFVDDRTLVATKHTQATLWDLTLQGPRSSGGNSHVVIAASDPSSRRFALGRNTEVEIKALSSSPRPAITGRSRAEVVTSLRTNFEALLASNPQVIDHVVVTSKVSALALAGDVLLVGTAAKKIHVYRRDARSPRTRRRS